MSVSKRQFSLGLVIAAAVCAAVFAIGGRAPVAGPTETVRPAAQPGPQEPKEPSEVRIVGPVPTYWAKTSDFDRAPATAQLCRRARKAAERPGAGASSMTFWWRRCSEQSRSSKCRQLP